ncbi:hypothetical protein Gorai_019645 [Gossypium raimondii]|uniref:Uncharacterized protein n=1 Tax=Gossypium raimondii TaxID=29730 RepID=A0A7J8PPB5_GOSRA|nr:hypothetical protein [Gossypium raimondii]
MRWLPGEEEATLRLSGWKKLRWRLNP